MKRDPERGMRSFAESFSLMLAVLLLILLFSNCVTRTRDAPLSNKSLEQAATSIHASQPQANQQQSPITTQNNSATAPTNINTASLKELEKLPGIGKELAGRIVEHREKYGPFRRPEHLIMVRGISDKRFRALRALITVE